jgi:ATP-binding cassette subfamily B protein
LLISFLIILFLAGALVLVDPLVTLTAGGGLGVAYGILTLANHKKLAACSHVISRENNQIMKSLQEGFGGIRDILLDGTQWLYEKLYQKADTAFRRAYANSTILAYSPRYIMETVGMVIFALLGLAMSQRSGGLAMALPTLGALAMGVQRLLPALQQAYQAWSTILAYQQSNQEVVELLGQPLPTWANLPQPAPLLFRQEIRFEDVKFCFSEDGLWVLDGLSLIISKGSRVGFIGKTGSGKSTCLDLLMGLLEPTEGRILIDGVPLTHKNLRAWQRNIAHVPQIIYLSDGTLAENIAFGIPSEKIEMNRVREAASQAQIAEFIDSSPKGYQTLIGERGIRLSGGQRQRIGIARALYKEAEILVFDEATSALDRETEEAVMQSIGSLSADLTILIVAHRTSTLKNCTQIIHLGKNQGL